MRIYTNPFEAMKETVRDVAEMGIDVHTKTYQDKEIGDDPDFATKEIQGYGFKIVDWSFDATNLQEAISYIVKDAEEESRIWSYIEQEHIDRTMGKAVNPGNAWKHRRELWEQFINQNESTPDYGRFSYTYAERFAPQLYHIVDRLQNDPSSRQAIITMHANLIGVGGYIDNCFTALGTDFHNAGGGGRIPCSMYYQIMIRNGKVDLIYTMRSCDLLTHFYVDIALALKLQRWFANELDIPAGTFTYFAGSLHAYAKDIKKRGEF